MARYVYTAIAATGEILEGRIEAPDRQTVIDRLHSAGHYDGPPTLMFTPDEGAETTDLATVVTGTADDDAGIASLTVNGASVAFSSSNDPNAPNEVTFSTNLVLQLGDNFITVTVIDISKRTTSQTHKVTVVENRPPVADAGADQVLACTSVGQTSITLDGSGSSDPDGDPLEFAWNGSFGTVTGEIATVAAPLGTTEVTLTVNDGLEIDNDTMIIAVNVNLSGLLPPLAGLVPEGETPPLPKNSFKQGRVLPLKLNMSCGTALTDADVAAPKIFALTPVGSTPLDLSVIDLDAGAANDNGTLFRYSDGQWIYNLNTKGLSAGTTYDITIELPDGQHVVARLPMK